MRLPKHLRVLAAVLAAGCGVNAEGDANYDAGLDVGEFPDVFQGRTPDASLGGRDSSSDHHVTTHDSGRDAHLGAGDSGSPPPGSDGGASDVLSPPMDSGMEASSGKDSEANDGGQDSGEHDAGHESGTTDGGAIDSGNHDAGDHDSGKPQDSGEGSDASGPPGLCFGSYQCGPSNCTCTQTCSHGECGACTSGFVTCSKPCDTFVDVDHCGSCSTQCPSCPNFPYIRSCNQQDGTYKCGC